MARDYKPPVNYRSAPSPVVAEPFEIVGGIGLLAEAPADPTNPATGITVTVGGNARTRVTGTPSVGQYRILTQQILDAQGQARLEYLPVLQFHSSDEGQVGAATYFRTGTVLTAEFFDLLKWFLTPITGVADLTALTAAFPPTSDVTKRGRPGDMALAANGVVYMSDGSTWRLLGVEQQNLAAFALALSLGFASTSAFSATWANARSQAVQFGFSSSESYIASGWLGALGLAVQLGISATSSFTASWTNGQNPVTNFGVIFSDSYTPPAGGSAPTFVAAGTAHASTPGIPAGIQADDVLVMLVSGYGGSTPSGWTAFSGGPLATMLYWKRTTGSESSPTLTGAGQCQIAAFRGCIATGDPIDVAGSQAWSDSTSPILLPSITTTVSNTLVCAAMVGIYGASLDSVGSTPTTADAFKSGGTTPVWLRYGAQASAGASGTTALNWSGEATEAAGRHFALKPA